MRLTQAIGHRTFTGRLELRRLHFTERTLAHTIHVPEGDSRDWGAIEDFAGEVADALLGEHAVPDLSAAPHGGALACGHSVQ